MSPNERDLVEIGLLTRLMADCREQERRYAERRRSLILGVRTRGGTTYEDIARAMGTSTQAVYKAMAARLYEKRVGGLSRTDETEVQPLP